MAKGSGSTRKKTYNIKNNYRSSFGFPNVANVIRTGRLVSRGETVQRDEVQRYLDSGRFDNYGSNPDARSDIANVIARDMSMRGYDAWHNRDEDFVRVRGTMNGYREEYNAIQVYKDRTGKWKSKTKFV